MKSNLILFITLLFTSLTFAQTKTGTIDTDYIIGKMPEMKEVLVRISNYAKQLDSSFQIKAKEYNDKIEAFKKVEKTLVGDDRNTKIQEIAVIEQDMGKFRKNGSTLIQLRRDEYMKPLYKKLNDAVKEIATTNGYTQILTTGGNQFAYIDERFDITKQVLAKLGIQE
ncbi:OmpH family outer membrane protein [Tenacibaculum sp. TC6]|uniref:OmpH family outer membrane protein n=1 Tax=Tenacibaculum sp. TC6 TaxID=3423223 RepID=UPI003D365745